jgi:hypothetical protein
MNPFFICSLPRSRTAWLANFLTYQHSFCFHEPMNRYPLKEYPMMLANTGRKHAGVSDSLNTLVIEELVDMFPSAKIVVIQRPIEEVEKSLNALGFPCSKLLEKMASALDKIIHAYDPLVIDYHNFRPKKIWYYLLPDQLDHARLAQLETFNITVPKDIIALKGMELMVKAGDLLWPLLR